MTRNLSTLLTVSFLALSLTLNAQSKAALQTIYINILKAENYQPSVDSDGDIVFKRGEYSYFIDVDESDQKYFRLVLPNIWPIDDELERLAVHAAVNEANRAIKIAKAQELQDNVWISVEILLDKPEDFRRHLDRIFSVIESSKDIFIEAMNR